MFTVTDCVKDSDTQVTLTLTVNGASDANSAAEILNGQIVEIGDSCRFPASFVSASFYPVFDYVEQDGDNLKITLELYAHSGTFANDLTSDMISFGYDFEGASVVSVERTAEGVAELIISVPANGQTDETLDMNGEVIIAAGGLINRWGDATGKDVEYLRNYTQESMGRSTYSNLSSLAQNASSIMATIENTAQTSSAALKTCFPLSHLRQAWAAAWSRELICCRLYWKWRVFLQIRWLSKRNCSKK